MKGDASRRKHIAVLAAMGLLAALATVVPATARPSKVQVVEGRGTGAPSFVSGIEESPRAAAPAEAALGHLRAHPSRYGITEPARALRVIEVIENGATATVRFAQRYKGLRVWGAQYLVHLRYGAVLQQSPDRRPGRWIGNHLARRLRPASHLRPRRRLRGPRPKPRDVWNQRRGDHHSQRAERGGKNPPPPPE